MRRVSVLSLVLALVSFGGPTGLAVAESAAPYVIVRDLQKLQDRIALGDGVAEAVHAQAMERTAANFVTRKKAVWKEKRNARALIVYLFSGGSAPAIGAAILPTHLASEYETLYSGALAYGLGDDKQASISLLPIDAKTLPNGLGGHLALVQASLLGPDQKNKSIALLDLARLLEPGTLIEEAALRKEMSLIGPSGDLDKFTFLSRRYLVAFPRSIYVDNFRQMVQQAAQQVGTGDTAEASARLTRLIAGLDKDTRRHLYLLIAREAVIAGRTRMAANASEEGGKLAGPADADAARAMTYFGAATIVGDRYDLGMKALSAAPVGLLDPRDQSLRASALSVADLIRRPPAASQGSADDNARAETLASAERSLAEADVLLKQVDK